MINKISLSKDKQVGFFISLLLLLLIANINNRIMVYIQDIYFYVVITAIFLFGNIIGKLVYDFSKSYYNRIMTKTNMSISCSKSKRLLNAKLSQEISN